MPEDLFKDITAGLENLEKQANNTAQALENTAEKVEKIEGDYDLKVDFQPYSYTYQGKEQRGKKIISPILTDLSNDKGDRFIQNGEGVTPSQLIRMYKQDRPTWSGASPRPNIEKLIASLVKQATTDIAISERERIGKNGKVEYDVNGKPIIEETYEVFSNEAYDFLNSLGKTNSKLQVFDEILTDLISTPYKETQKEKSELYSKYREKQQEKESAFSRKSHRSNFHEITDDVSEFRGNDADVERGIADLEVIRTKRIQSLQTRIEEEKKATEDEIMSGSLGANNATEKAKKELKHLARFSVMAPTISNIEGSNLLIDDDQKEYLSQMKVVSEIATSSLNGAYSDFLTEGKDLSPAQKNEAFANFPKFLEDYSTKLQSLLENKDNSLDPRVTRQIEERIVSLSRILSAWDLTSERKSIKDGDSDSEVASAKHFNEINEMLQKDIFGTFFDETNTHSFTWKTPSGKDVTKSYRGNAFRNIWGKQGIKTEGRMPVAPIPQIALGSLPYFPNKDLPINALSKIGKPYFPEKDDLVGFVTKLMEKVIAINPNEEERTPEQKKEAAVYEKVINDAIEASKFTQEAQQRLDVLKAKKKASSLSSIEDIELNNLRAWKVNSRSSVTKAKEQLMDADFHSDASGYIKYKQDFEGGQIPYAEIVSSLTSQKEALSTDKLKKIIEVFKKYLLDNNRQELYKEADKDAWGDEAEFRQIADLTERISQGETFSEEDMELNDDYLDILEDAFQYDEKGNLKLEPLQNRALELKGVLSKSVENVTSNAIQQGIDELEEELLDRKLTPYIDEYKSTNTSSQKGAISKKLQKDFGIDKNSSVYQKFIKMREKKETEDMELKMDSEATSGGLESSAPWTIAKNITKKFEGSEKVYSGQGIQTGDTSSPKFLSEIAQEFQEASEERRQDILSHLQELFDSSTLNEKEWIIEELKRVSTQKNKNRLFEVFDLSNAPRLQALVSSSFEKTSQEKGDTPQEKVDISTEKEALVEDNEALLTEQTVSNEVKQGMQTEEQQLSSLNNSLLQHTKLVEMAAEAEEKKKKIAQELGVALKSEGKAIKDENLIIDAHTQSVLENTEATIQQTESSQRPLGKGKIITAEDVSNSKFIPTNFFENGHTYREVTTPMERIEYNKEDKMWYLKGTAQKENKEDRVEPEYARDDNGDYISLPSSTSIVGAVFGKEYQSYLSQFGRMIGNFPDADIAGLQSEYQRQFGANNEKKSLEIGLKATSRGTLAHKGIELIEKYNAENPESVISSVSELTGSYLQEYTDLKTKLTRSLQIIGMTESSIENLLNVDGRISSNMSLNNLMNATGIKASETPLAAQIGDFKFAGTLDKIMGVITDDAESLMLADMKNTDNLSEDTASYQVNLQKYLLKAASDFMKKVFDVDVNQILTSGIYQLGDKGVSRFVPVDTATPEIIAQLLNSYLSGAQTGKFPNLINREGIVNVPSVTSRGGSFVPTGSNNGSNGTTPSNIRYLTSAEMLGSTETKEAFLQEGKNNQAIRAYSRILEKQLKTTQEIYSVNAQIDRLSSMDGNKAKEQLELLQKKAQHQAEILQSLDKERKLIEDNVAAGKFDEKQVAAVAEIQEIYRNQLEGYRAAGTYEGQNASIKTDELTYKQAEASYLSALKDKGNLQWRQTKLNTLLSDKTISADVKAGYESQLQEINSQLRPYAQNPSTDLSSEGLKNLTPDENGMYKIEWFDRAKKSMVEYYGTLQQVQEMAGQVQLEQGKINVKIGQAATPTQKSLGLFTSILTGFKASLRNLTDYSLAYMIIGKIKQSFQQLIQTTKELDKVMVDLQIVTGTNRKEAKSLLGTYNELALEIGRSTTSVATASNDWLRAGYEGEKAADLTKASMYLSVLGMEDSAQATTQLISSLKGWKIEASEVMSVVDKLTVTICGVCTVMCIGHKTNCR